MHICSKDAKLGEKAARVFKDFIARLTKLKRPAQRFYLTVSASVARHRELLPLQLFNGLRSWNEKTNERAIKSFTHDLLLRWIAMRRHDRRSLAQAFPSVAHALNSRTVRDYAGITLR